MLLACVRHRVKQTEVAKRFMKMESNVEALTTFFQAQYGRKFYHVMKKSGQFSEEQLAGMRSGMMASNHWIQDKMDDVGDFLGLTECSSEDDYTIQDVTRHLQERVTQGYISPEEFQRRNMANRSRAEQKAIKQKMKQKGQ